MFGTILGALALSSGAAARSLSDDDGNFSKASCKAVSLGVSDASDSGELYVDLAVEASEYICHGVGSVDEVAEKTAHAFAYAVAQASVACEVVGDAKVQADAHASSYASAELWVSSYFGAFADASTCSTCDAWASSYGYISKYVFLEAYASASTSVRTPLVVLLRIDNTVNYEDLKKVVVSAYAGALAAAAHYKEEEGCLAFVNAGGCIWFEGLEDEKTYCAGCSAVAFSEGSVDSIDAIATAGAKAGAFSCGNSVDFEEVEDFAKAVATATAQAISYMLAGCESDEGGYACAAASTNVSVWVRAVVEAIAGSWANALSCKANCLTGVDLASEAIFSVLVDATTEAYGAVCVSGSGSWTVEDLEAEIVSKSLCAIAYAAAGAIATPDLCLSAGFTFASAGVCPSIY